MTRGRPRISRNSTTLQHPLQHQYDNSSDDDDSLSGHSFGDDDDDAPISGLSVNEEKQDSIRSETVAATSPPPRTIKPKKKSQVTTVGRKVPRTNNSRDLDFGGGINSTSEHSASTYSSSRGRTPTIPGERKNNRLLRERRLLREKLKAQEKDLYYHFFGTILNTGLAFFALSLICGIATTGGLCVLNGDFQIFDNHQRERCSLSSGKDKESGECVRSGDEQQCYFPYS